MRNYKINHVPSYRLINYDRIAHDVETAPGIEQVIAWVAQERPTQSELQFVHSAVKQLRLGYHPYSSDECVQAAFARGADKVLRCAIEHSRGVSARSKISVKIR